MQNRFQRVKLSNIFSDWLSLNRGMPQESWLGPLTFIVVIDDLSTGYLVHKFVDDSTLSEIIGKDGVSLMETYFGDSICSKASSRLHFLTQLKRNCATVKDMVHFYDTLIRSVLEYACPAWHSSLTVELESELNQYKDDRSS